MHILFIIDKTILKGYFHMCINGSKPLPPSQHVMRNPKIRAISLYGAKKYFVSHCYTVLQG